MKTLTLKFFTPLLSFNIMYMPTFAVYMKIMMYMNINKIIDSHFSLRFKKKCHWHVNVYSDIVQQTVTNNDNT